MRLGDDRMHWVAVQGPNTLNGTYTAAQFAWSPLASRPQDVSITMGPSIPAHTRLTRLAIGGDYAATIGCEDSASNPDCRLFVVQFSTKRLWTLHQRPGGNVFADVMAVTPTEVIVSEQDVSSQFFTRLLRIEIAHLADLGW